MVQSCEDRKRQEFYRSNRIRANIYKQKVLHNVLNKRTKKMDLYVA